MADETCGAWDNCPLPKGHNMGNLDIPQNHQSRVHDPMCQRYEPDHWCECALIDRVRTDERGKADATHMCSRVIEDTLADLLAKVLALPDALSPATSPGARPTVIDIDDVIELFKEARNG